MHTCIITPLFQLYLSSSLLPSPLPRVTLGSLRYVYSFLYHKHYLPSSFLFSRFCFRNIYIYIYIRDLNSRLGISLLLEPHLHTLHFYVGLFSHWGRCWLFIKSKFHCYLFNLLLYNALVWFHLHFVCFVCFYLWIDWLVGLVFEHRTLQLQSRSSNAWATPADHFALLILEMEFLEVLA
jgi:hypothetical protein